MGQVEGVPAIPPAEQPVVVEGPPPNPEELPIAEVAAVRPRQNPIRPPRARRGRYTAADRRHALMLYDSGHPLVQCAREVAPTCSHSTVLRWVRQRQIRFRQARIRTAYRNRVQQPGAQELQNEAEESPDEEEQADLDAAEYQAHLEQAHLEIMAQFDQRILQLRAEIEILDQMEQHHQARVEPLAQGILDQEEFDRIIRLVLQGHPFNEVENEVMEAAVAHLANLPFVEQEPILAQLRERQAQLDQPDRLIQRILRQPPFL